MAVLSNIKHDHFAMLVAKGVSPTKAYVQAGYSKVGANTNASRLIANDLISARIKELKTTITEQVITAEIRRRSWRVQILQERLDGMLALSQARAKMYADSMSEGHRFQVNDKTAEAIALEEGCTILELPPAVPTPGADWKDEPKPAAEYPKTMIHPGYSVGGNTGLLMKDFRGKDANQEIWKFDSALSVSINATMKQAAIEEGQWTEKREVVTNSSAESKARINRGRDRLAAEKKAAEARGEVWR